MHEIGVGFFVGAGVPRGPRVNTFIECGCCGAYHRTDFNGDCREDSERHYELPDDAVVMYLDDDEDDDDSYDGLEMSDDSCGECGHPYKRGDETHYPECSRIKVEEEEDDGPIRIPCSKCGQLTTRDTTYGDLRYRCCRADNE